MEVSLRGVESSDGRLGMEVLDVSMLKRGRGRGGIADLKESKRKRFASLHNKKTTSNKKHFPLFYRERRLSNKISHIILLLSFSLFSPLQSLHFSWQHLLLVISHTIIPFSLFFLRHGGHHHLVLVHQNTRENLPGVPPQYSQTRLNRGVFANRSCLGNGILLWTAAAQKSLDTAHGKSPDNSVIQVRLYA